MRTHGGLWFPHLVSLLPIFLAGCGADREQSRPSTAIGELFTLVVLPDTQYYAESYAEIFRAQTRWIEEQVDERGIIAVLHVGDIVDDNGEAQWTVARDALAPLIGVVPIVFALGNHDYGEEGLANDRSTRAHEFLPVDEITAQSSFGGSYESGRLDNSYSVLDTPEGPWLVLALEFGPRDPILDWANQVVTQHEGMPGIVLTHAYLYSDDTRYDWLTKGELQQWSPHSYELASLAPVNDGQAIFEKLVRDHDDIGFVFCGHVLNDGVARLSSMQAGGGVVHEILANYQMNDMGGEGFLRLIEFRHGSPEVQVRTYSPWLDEYKQDPANEFRLSRLER